MKINCLDFSLKLIEVINFTFDDESFKITLDNSDEYYNIDDNVEYLEITYSSLEDLSLLHLFLVQHKQETLRLGKVKIIIIEDFQPSNEEKCILYNCQHEVQDDQYWLNIATLSVQIGYQVKSISHENEQIYKETQNKIIVVSAKFPDFDICELDNHFTDFIGETKKKDIPVEQLFERLKLPEGVNIKNFENTFLVLLQHISIKIHQIVGYAHFLPMTLAYNAFYINQKISNLDDSKVNYQLLQSQQIYLSGSLLQKQIQELQKINYFNLPLHLLNRFNFAKTKCIFQQMCDISYLFKAEFFCIYQQYNNLENAVVSQSSRSGKSVSILSVYYFNIITKQKIPIYINLAYSTIKKNIQDQPLYNHTSISVADSISIIGDFLSEGVNYRSLFSYSLTQSQSYQRAYSKVYHQIRNYFCFFDIEQSNKLIFQLFNIKEQDQFKFMTKNYNNLVKVISTNQTFNTNELLGLLGISNKVLFNITLLFIVLYVLNIKVLNIALNGAMYLLIGLIILNQVYQSIYEKYFQKQKNEDKEIIILVDEVLQLQKDKFDNILSRVQEVTKFFSGKLLDKVKYFSDFIYDRLIEQSTDYEIFMDNIQNILKLFQIKTENSEEKDLENIKKKVNEIKGNEERETYVYKYLLQQYFDDNVSLNQFIESICVTSPNFLNLKQYIKSCNLFYNQFKDFKIYLTKHVLDQCLFKFIMQLYNPRAIETIFWRNMYHDLQKTQDQDLLPKETFNKELENYLVFTDFFQKQYEFNLLDQKHLNKQYKNPQTFKHGAVHLLSIGTDLAIINFISQNELLFTSPSSRSDGEYTQSHIIGGVQIHSSLLGCDYYQMSNISQATSEQLKKQINNRLSTQDIQTFYLLQIPELASEIQFVCPLVSPQIIIAGNIAGNNLITNSVNFYTYKVNVTTHNLQIIDSYTQIINSLKINRTNRFITLVSSQLKEDNTYNIYADKILSNQFHLNLFVSTSMQLNQDMVFYFLYQASQNFKSYISKKQDQNVTQQAEISRLYFNYQTISEITAIIQFLIVITQIDHIYFKQYLQDYQMKNFYLQLIQITRCNNQKVEKSVFSDTLEPLKILQQYFKDAEFMFLQPCIDFITSIWDNEELTKMDILMQHLYTILAKCYHRLIRLLCIQSLGDNGQQSFQPFIIAVPIDKNKIYNKFEVNGSVADFLVAFFPGNQQSFEELSKHLFLKQHVQIINNESIQFFTCLVESGIHIKEVLAQKAEINHNSIFYITPYVQNKAQLQTDLYIELFVGKYKINEIWAIKTLVEEQKSFDKLQSADLTICGTNSTQLVETPVKVDNVFANQKKIYIRFDTLYLKIYQSFFQNLHFDKDSNEYYTYMTVQLQEYLDQKQLNHKVHVLNEQNQKQEENGIFVIVINKTALIQQWSSRQSNQNQLDFENFLNNYLIPEINFLQYEQYLTMSFFLNGFQTLLKLLRNKLANAACIHILNYDFDIKMSAIRPTEIEIIQFFNQKNLVILGCVENIFYAYMFKAREIIENWVHNYFNDHPDDADNVHIKNYIKTFNSVIVTEENVKNANLELFANEKTVQEQIQLIIDQAFLISKKGKIDIEIINTTTTQRLSFIYDNHTATDIIIKLPNMVIFSTDINKDKLLNVAYLKIYCLSIVDK